MKIRVKSFDLRFVPLRTRMPFRYGIATVTAVPQVLLFLDVAFGARVRRGVAADVLAPKWFTKDPLTTYEQDIADMLDVIRAACQHAAGAGVHGTVFDLWSATRKAQEAWAQPRGLPPLLWGFGVSLVERALIDAFCRASRLPFSEVVRRNSLGARLGEIYPELTDVAPAVFLPGKPLHRLTVRHTVGMADPLTDGDITAGARLNDGLPQSLEACIRHYGLTHFKIKLPAEPQTAAARLDAIAALVTSTCRTFAFTLDGNEFLRDIAALRDLWRMLESVPRVAEFLQRGLIALEQPLARDVALTEGVRDGLASWHDHPAMIIDESDSDLSHLPRALECGYNGTSHKNCKGVFKGIASACLLERRRRLEPQGRLLLTGEDLMNTGPVALLQDIAVLATIGVAQAERNGHHYFGGLDAFPETLWPLALQWHSDIYQQGPSAGRAPVLALRKGALGIGSLVQAPFGCAFDLNADDFWSLEHFTPADLAR